MKRKIIYVAATLLGASFMSCSESNDIILESTSEGDVKEYSPRSIDEAIQIAKDAASWEHGQTTRSDRHDVEIENVEIIKDFGTRSSTFTSDTLIYAVNFADDNGFALVSANRATDALLAVTERGHYSICEKCEIEGFNLFVELAKKYVDNPDHSGPGFIDPIPFLDYDTILTQVPPMLSIHWGQRFPAGKYCPNEIAGCAPLALAQIIAHYETPLSLTLTYSNADIPTQNFEWDDIHWHIRTANDSLTPHFCLATDSAHNAIGRLCRQIGEYMGSSYNTNSTSTYRSGILSGIASMGYSSNLTWQSYYSRCTKSHLESNHPIYFTGSINSETGHAWVVDGCYGRKITLVYAPPGASPYPEGTVIEDSYFNHINWGWDGKFDGYYSDGVFNLANYWQLDYTLDPNTATYYNFNSDIKYVVPLPN